MRVMGAVCMLVLAAAGGAQAPVPPTRSLGPVVATSQPMAAANQLRQLSDGRVLVNIVTSSQVVLLDSLLKPAAVVLDSAGPPDRRRYGGRGGVLIPYVGDTTLFYDRTAAALVVLDGSGNVARVAAPPSGTAGGFGAASRLDAKGRILYTQTGGRSGPSPTQPGMRRNISYSVLMAFDMGKRTVDTVIWIRNDTVHTPAPAPGEPVRPASIGAARLELFPAVTVHAVMSDGTVAIVRGQDYRIDWVGPDGAITQSPRIAHEWKRLTDDDKKRMADSMTVLRDSTNKAMLATMRWGDGRTPMYDATGRIIGVSFSTTVSVDGVPLPSRAAPPPPPPHSLVPVPPDLVPDYLPAITIGVLADADNRLWIPLSPAKLPPNTRVFDIVDRSGKLVDRVRVDPSHQIVGFGKGGNVYLFVRDGGVGRLQRVRFK